jgi:hypothetical protein
MSNLLKLINLCKCSVIITVNQHRNSFTDINEYVEEYVEETKEDIINEIIKKDTIVELQVYPNTPNGFLTLVHYDIDIAIDLMIEYLTKK